MPLNHIFRNCPGEYKFSISDEKIDHIMYMDYINVFTKNEKKTKTKTNGDTDTSNKDIEPVYRNGNWYSKMFHADNEKWEKKINGRNEICQIKKESECLEKMKITST